MRYKRYKIKPYLRVITHVAVNSNSVPIYNKHSNVLHASSTKPYPHSVYYDLNKYVVTEESDFYLVRPGGVINQSNETDLSMNYADRFELFCSERTFLFNCEFISNTDTILNLYRGIASIKKRYIFKVAYSNLMSIFKDIKNIPTANLYWYKDQI